MTESLELTLLIASGLILVSVLVSPLATRLGAPILLVFLGIGMLVGQNGPGGIDFNDFQLSYEIGSVTLAIILFAGGLGTRLEEVRVCWGPAIVLATLGVILTSGIVGVAVWLLGQPILLALLMGAVIGSTDAAATFLLLQGRGIHLRGRVMETIVVESGLNDPMAIFLTVILVSFVDAGAAELSWDLLRTFAVQLGVGALAGILGGVILGWTINRLNLPAGLCSVLALAGAIALFAGTELVGGSGYLALYLCGIAIMHRMRGRKREELDMTHGSLAWLSQIVMFLMLGLLVTPGDFDGGVLFAGIIAIVLMFVARPLAVAIVLAPFHFAPKERLFIAWVGLRGAVPIFLAIIPVLSPGPVNVTFFNVVFMVVLASLVLQGWTIPWLARHLGLEATPTESC